MPLLINTIKNEKIIFEVFNRKDLKTIEFGQKRFWPITENVIILFLENMAVVLVNVVVNLTSLFPVQKSAGEDVLRTIT